MREDRRSRAHRALGDETTQGAVSVSTIDHRLVLTVDGEREQAAADPECGFLAFADAYYPGTLNAFASLTSIDAVIVGMVAPAPALGRANRQPRQTPSAARHLRSWDVKSLRGRLFGAGSTVWR